MKFNNAVSEFLVGGALMASAFAASSCAHDDHVLWDKRPVPVYVNQDADPACLEALDYAINFWADVGVEYLEVRWSDSSKAVSYGINVFCQGGRAPKPTTLGQAGFYGKNVAMVFIYDYNDHTMTHELGHALGLEHSEDPENVMYKFNMTDNNAVSDTQLDQIL